METNFSTGRCLLLQNSKKIAIAVISCESGLNDISDKLTQAISDHLNSGVVQVTNNQVITDNKKRTDFSVSVFEDFEFKEVFTLIFIPVY